MLLVGARRSLNLEMVSHRQTRSSTKLCIACILGRLAQAYILIGPTAAATHCGCQQNDNQYSLPCNHAFCVVSQCLRLLAVLLEQSFSGVMAQSSMLQYKPTCMLISNTQLGPSGQTMQRCICMIALSLVQMTEQRLENMDAAQEVQTMTAGGSPRGGVSPKPPSSTARRPSVSRVTAFTPKTLAPMSKAAASRSVTLDFSTRTFTDLVLCRDSMYQ